MKQVANWVSGASIALVVGASLASAQQVMWKDNPITGKVVGLTYGATGWNQGEIQARLFGGHLATIRSSEENDWLIANFSQWWQTPAVGVGAWIGLADFQSEGAFQWTSGTPFSYGTGAGAPWVSGNPNNGGFGGDADYVRFAFGVTGWGWDDVSESVVAKSLIEVPCRPNRSWSSPRVVPGLSSIGYASDIEYLDVDGDNDDDVVAMADIGPFAFSRCDGPGVFTECYWGGMVGDVDFMLGSAFGWRYQLEKIDVDGDGAFEFLLAGGGCRIFRINASNAPAAIGELVVQDSVGSVCVSDVDGDSRSDVVLGTYSGNIKIYYGGAGGMPGSVAGSVIGPIAGASIGSSRSGVLSVAVLDSNGDGYGDIVAAGAGLNLFRSTIQGGFAPAIQLGVGTCSAVRCLDLLGDARPEIVAARLAPSRLEAWSMDAAGNFQLVSTTALVDSPNDMGIGDLDCDGDSDLVVSNLGSQRKAIYYDDGESFYLGGVVDSGINFPAIQANVVVADVNGDGALDVSGAYLYPAGFNNFWHENQSFVDCNANGIADVLEFPFVAVGDCNGNARPDRCDFASGASLDSDNDGILNECEPTLVSLTPSILPSSTGGTVTVRGANIPDGTVRLDLDGLPVNFTMTGNVGTAVIPRLTNPRSADLVVAGTLRFGTGPNDVTGATPAVFTWDVPDIVATNPLSAPYDQATGVVFTLEDHVATSGVGTATFGSAAPQPATLFSANGQTKVVTIAPAQPAPGPVSVLLRFGTETTLEDRGFVYLGPGLTGMSQTSGWQVGGEQVALQLYDFVPDLPVAVRFGTGETSDLPVGLLSASTLWVTTPFTVTSGAVDVEVVQVLGPGNEKRVLSPGAWLANPPRVDTSTPNSVYQGGGEVVTLVVAGFPPGAQVLVRLTHAATGVPVQVPATVVGTLDAAQAVFTVPLLPYAGAVDVDVLLYAGTPAQLVSRLPGSFTVVGASLASVAPASGPLEGGTTVVAQTSGFQAGVAAQVSLGGMTVAGVVAGSGANQTVTFRTTLANASGASDVTITQGVFQATLPAGFAFDAPRIIGYCTAKLTGQGTLPVIGFSGSPSVTTGDFAITLSNALPNKTAQYFYGTTASNFPLFGGFLCAGGGVVRGPLSSTNAASAASVPFPVTAPLVGSKRYFQWWFRDPLDPAGSGRGLSAGLEVEFYN